jgi:hypothetical protein
MGGVNWIEKTPLWLFAFAAIAFALVPIGHSHFVEKWTMLFSGTLRRPLDWFDLVMHTTPTVLLVLKLLVMVKRR